tara:strand:+ start:6458 stop:7408 length:951 start_codon:yes stop_codon:yes gene_type:complete
MGKRIGLLRTQALLENLKREINLENTTFARKDNVIFRWNYIDCQTPIISNLAGNGGADGVMAAGDKFSAIFPGPNVGDMYPVQACCIGAHTVAAAGFKVEGTVVATDTNNTAAGLNLQGDAATADNTGLEMILGGTEMGGASACTIGTHSMTIDATFYSEDYTDADAVTIGFRKVQAFQTGHGAALAAASGDPLYTDFVAFGVQSADDVQIASDINDGGSGTYTDTTQATAASKNHRFKISVTKAGVVTYQHVGAQVMDSGTLAAPTTTAAYTFDSGDVVVPYLIIQRVNADSQTLLKSITVTRVGGPASYVGAPS